MGLRRARGIFKRIVLWGTGVLMLAGIGAFTIAWFRSDNDCATRRATTPRDPMQAITFCDYGTSEVLHLEPIEKPVPNDVQMLIRVRAAALNPLDWHYLRGTPYLMRMSTGLRKPVLTQLGVDFAGTVEAVGKGITRFKAGDDVFGVRNGAFSEYVVAREDRGVVAMPAGVTFEQAASIPVAGVTALQSLRDKGRMRAGEKVLINGASGGVGTFGVQLAKALGAHVTGVCSTRNLEMVRSLGADEVIDYTKEDFAKSGRQFDLIIDNVGTRPLGDFRRVMTPTGRYVMVAGGGPNDGPWIGPFGKVIGALLLSPFIKQEMGMMIGDVTPGDLTLIADLIQQGKVTPVIDRRYPLGEVPAAIAYLEEGHARGKVIITME